MKLFSNLLLLLIAVAASCQSQTTGNVLDPAAFQGKIKETPKGVVLDVRTPEEFSSGYIANAVNVDYNSENFKAEVSKLDTHAAYFVYCRSGKRSANAASYMRSVGFSKVYELSGGITSWQENKLPVVTGPAK